MSTPQSKRVAHRPFALRCAGPAVIVFCLTALSRPALPATITDLGTLGGSYSSAGGINASGQVVGDLATAGNGPDHAFLYSGGVMHDLGTLGGPRSSAFGINGSGQIVGFSSMPGDAAYHAFSYSGGVMHDLGTLGGSSSAAIGINASGQVVGISFTTGTSYPSDAFLYSGGIMIDLNSLLPADSGWQLSSASAINDSGQIVGYGSINGQYHAFLLDTESTPEPGSLALLGTGLVAVGLRRCLRPGRKS